MRRSWLGFVGAACLLAASGCTTDTGGGTSRSAGPACIEACDAAYDVCSGNCEDDVDDQLCSQECIDTLSSCKKRCE